MLPCVCSVIDQRRNHNAVKTLVTPSTITLTTTFFCSYRVFTSSVKNHTKKCTGQHGIYSLSLELQSMDVSDVLFCCQYNHHPISDVGIFDYSCYILSHVEQIVRQQKQWQGLYLVKYEFIFCLHILHSL